MATIGLFGEPSDQEVAALAQRLEHRGVEPWIVDLATFPGSLEITRAGAVITIDGRPLADMDAAYLRRVGRNLPPHATYDVSVSATEDRWRNLFEGTLSCFAKERSNQVFRNSILRALARSRPVINVPERQNLHRLKPFALRLLGGQVPLPRYAAGSDAERMRAFARTVRADGLGVVDKPLAGIYKTELWDQERWRAQRWRTRPALYQRYVEGDTIRCYVLDGRLLSAARIVHGGTVDSSKSQTGIEVIELPEDGRAIAVNVAQSLNLPFCGLDLMRDAATGELRVIDCNLSPMFVNYARMSHCDIPGHLADYLIARSERHDRRRPEVLELVDQAKSLLSEDRDIADLLAGKRRNGS